MGPLLDHGDVAFRPDVWVECLRVLKPGGYVVAFGGCRTYHRLATAIEDAGFVLHPMLIWAFASGFPKATNASKMLDKVDGRTGALTSNTGKWRGGQSFGGGQARWVKEGETTVRVDHVPQSPEAARWEGWAYGQQSLKPAIEPICLAQKPMIGTGVQNLLQHGVGAVHIAVARSDSGRWPANLLLDGSDEVAGCFPHTKSHGNRTPRPMKRTDNLVFGHGLGSHAAETGYADVGSAARFFPALGYDDEEVQRIFYTPKANNRERNGSSHPTIKPIKLMTWLCRLITPPGGVVLDPFAGSGSTRVAAMNCGCDAILIEREAEYIADIERRFALLI